MTGTITEEDQPSHAASAEATCIVKEKSPFPGFSFPAVTNMSEKEMNIAAKIREALGAKPDDAGDILARMLMAAKEDSAFRGYILSILRMPPAQRESLINTALHEMRLRGESEATCAAFAALATDDGAANALRFLREK